MPGRKAARLLVGLSAAIAVLGMAISAEAQEKKIKIGVIYDLTGPLAGGGSELQYIGAKIMLDQYAKTGVEGYKVEAVYADAQSKPDVAINEAVRLIWGPEGMSLPLPSWLNTSVQILPGINYSAYRLAIIVVTLAVAGSGTPSVAVSAAGTTLAGTYGDLLLRNDGSYSYLAGRADAVATGSTVNDVFTYQVSDGHGGTATQVVTVTINGVNDAPSITTATAVASA